MNVLMGVTLCFVCQLGFGFSPTNYTCVIQALNFTVATDGCYNRNLSLKRQVCTVLDGHQSEHRNTSLTGRQSDPRNVSSSCASLNITTFTQVMSCFYGYHDISVTVPTTIVRADNSTLCPTGEIVTVNSITTSWKLQLYKYLQPAIILVGLIGNMLSFLVMSSKYMGQFSFSVYLKTLAVLDSLVLFHYGMTYVDTVSYHKEPIFGFRMRSHTACLIYPYIVGVAQLSSAWCVVVFTVDRAVAICKPFYAREHFTNFRSRVAVGFIIGFMMLSQIYHQIFLKEDIKTCPEPFSFPLTGITLKAIDVFAFISKIILLMLLPFAVVLVCNICVILAVKRRRAVAEVHVGPSTVSDKDNGTGKNQDTERGMSLKLCSVSVTFLVLSLPDAIMVVMDLRNILLDVHKWYLRYKNFRHMARMIFSLNFAINYLLYGIAFRKQVILCRTCRKYAPDDVTC